MSAKIITTVYDWLREMKIPVSKTYIKQKLLSHPDYPSLLSITDTLTDLRIENTAVQIEKDQLHEVDIPFLAHLNGNGGDFVIIRNRDNPDHQVPGFYKRWGGVIIAAEKPLNWINQENNDLLNKESKTAKVFILSLCIFGSFVFFSAIASFDWMKIGLELIAIAGIFVSWMVVSKDLGLENKIADQVCGKNADCNSVIHSTVGKLPFKIGWSDAGMIYFPFLLLTLLVASFTDSLVGIYPLLVLLAAMAMPITIVSIYYQRKVIKKWCRLCLITDILLWLQFFVLLPQTSNQLHYGFSKTIFIDTVLPIFLLFVIATTWLWLKALIKQNKKSEEENFASERFRRSQDIFYALLERQKKITVNPDGLGIIIGNPEATNTITKICNPYCGPCANAHPLIERLLEEKENLKVQILFTSPDDDKNIMTKPTKHLMALYEKNESQLIEKALDDWYGADKKDYDVFAGKYILNGELERQSDKLKAMRTWCIEMKIEFTPTFFINGYQLPKQYTIADVKYFLEE
ncbi:MAG TPA: vitamin K epoxide reductase family protein [Chitinophagaceae bacterium]|nr:vitamin K epoxide reductase family protein [Chitinophagaceae bacterium]